MTGTRVSGEQTLPNGWAWTTLGEIAQLAGGGTPSRKVPEYFGGSIVWLTPTEIPKTRITVISNSKERITEKGLRRSSAKLLPTGSVLMTSRASIGYVAIAGTEISTNQGFASFICHDGLYNFYLAYWLWGNADQFIQRATGTTFKEISKSKLRPFQFPLAPLPEQQRIVAEIETQLTRLEAGGAALKRAQANLRRYRASVLKAACEGRLVATEAELARAEGREYEPAELLLELILGERRAKWEAEQWEKEIKKARKEAAQAKRKAAGLPYRIRDLADAEWQDLTKSEYSRYLPKNDSWRQKYKEPVAPAKSGLPELPEGWAWATWNQISNWVTYGFTRPMPHVDEGIPIVTAKNVHDRRLDFDNTHRTTLGAFQNLSDKDRPQPGDILITKDGTIGRAAEVMHGEPFCINQSVAVVWLRSCPCDRVYLVAVIEAPATQKQILEAARGVAIKHLSITDFARLVLPLPPLHEQHRIAAEVERRLSVVAELDKQVKAALRRAERLRQAILKHALEGKLVPQDPNDEPASVLLERIKEAREGARRAESRRPGARVKRTRQSKPTRIDVQTPEDLRDLLTKLRSEHRVQPRQLWGASNLRMDEFYALLEEAIRDGYIVEQRLGYTVHLEVGDASEKTVD